MNCNFLELNPKFWTKHAFWVNYCPIFSRIFLGSILTFCCLNPTFCCLNPTPLLVNPTDRNCTLAQLEVGGHPNGLTYQWFLSCLATVLGKLFHPRPTQISWGFRGIILWIQGYICIYICMYKQILILPTLDMILGCVWKRGTLPNYGHHIVGTSMINHWCFFQTNPDVPDLGTPRNLRWYPCLCWVDPNFPNVCFVVVSFISRILDSECLHFHLLWSNMKIVISLTSTISITAGADGSRVELGQFPQAKVLRRKDWGWAICNSNVVCCSWAKHWGWGWSIEEISREDERHHEVIFMVFGLLWSASKILARLGYGLWLDFLQWYWLSNTIFFGLGSGLA